MRAKLTVENILQSLNCGQIKDDSVAGSCVSSKFHNKELTYQSSYKSFYFIQFTQTLQGNAIFSTKTRSKYKSLSRPLILSDLAAAVML